MDKDDGKAFSDAFDLIKDESFMKLRREIKKLKIDLDICDRVNGDKSLLMRIIEDKLPTEKMWVLLEFLADPNVQDAERKTPLHYAVAADNKDMILALLMFGANPDLTDKDEKKPFEDNTDLESLSEKVVTVKRQFLTLTRKRRKYLKYFFDAIDTFNNKSISAPNLADMYIRINEESMDTAMKDASTFVNHAKISKTFGEDNVISYEEFILAICKIIQVHGIKPIDDLIERFKKLRVKKEDDDDAK